MPNPRDMALPEDATLLEAWFIAVLRSAAPEAVANERFHSREVVAAMRRVMSNELPRLI